MLPHILNCSWILIGCFYLRRFCYPGNCLTFFKKVSKENTEDIYKNDSFWKRVLKCSYGEKIEIYRRKNYWLMYLSPNAGSEHSVPALNCFLIGEGRSIARFLVHVFLFLIRIVRQLFLWRNWLFISLELVII